MKLLGYESATQSFSNSFKAGKMHHAWLIAGEKGIGKATFARFIAQAVLANRDQGSFVFEYNQQVAAKIEHGSHPDCHILTTDEKGTIGVDEVRQLIKFMHLTAVEGAHKVAIIDYCDGMTTNAANALLKILEEPPAGALLLLVCNLPGKLLATVRSRCRLLKIESPTTQVFASAIKNATSNEFTIKEIGELYNLSHGSIGLALSIIEHKALDLILQIEKQVYNESRIDAALNIAQAVASNQALWGIVSYFIPHFLQEKIKKYSKEGKNYGSLLEELNKCNSLLLDCDKLHLDKGSVVMNLLGAM